MAGDSTLNKKVFLPSRFPELSEQAASLPPAKPVNYRVWGVAGTVIGILLALLWFAPAAWLASAIERQTGGRLLLAETEGSLWTGSALPVLTGGPGSRDASVLPSRLRWTVRPMLTGLRLTLQQECCLPQSVAIEWRWAFRGQSLAVVPSGDGIAQFPAAWLSGLGTPFNTLQPQGTLRLGAQNLMFESTADGWRMRGRAQLDLVNMSSRVSTLEPLGTYRLDVQANAGNGPAEVKLTTLSGALQLSGSGQLGARGLRFRGDARAASGAEAALDNLLNIIGRRQGATSAISIG